MDAREVHKRISAAALLGSGLLLLLGSASAQDLPGVPVFGGGAVQPGFVMEGVPERLATNVRNSLTILSEPCDTSLLRLQRLIPNAEREVTAAVNALGYYRSNFTLTTFEGPACWMLRVDMQPGPRILLEAVDITFGGPAATEPLFTDILRDSTVRTGMPLDHGAYEELKNTLSETAIDNGYFGARFGDARIAIDLQQYKADVTLQFDAGNQYRFGDINLVQGDPLLQRDFLLPRDTPPPDPLIPANAPPQDLSLDQEIDAVATEAKRARDAAIIPELLDILTPIHTGEPYSNEQLSELRRNLESSQYFRLVRITPRPNQAVDEAVPIDVELSLLPRHAFSTGIGFTTDSGPRVRGSYENRFLNTHGHRLLLNTSLSPVRTEIDANYRIPIRSEHQSSLNFTGGYSAEDNDSYNNKQFKLVSGIRTEYSSGWLQNVFLDFQRNADEIELLKNTSVLSLLGASLSRTSADNLLNPSEGWKLFAQVQGASQSLLSDTSLLQVYGNAKYIKAFGRSRVLTRIEGGATLIDETADLPANLRFFAGGDQSIRGFDYRAIAPRAEGLRDGQTTSVLGGKFLLVGSVEYDYRVLDKWRAAVFTDNGYVFNNKNNMELQHSVGIGVRWLSPLGPIRVDLAHPFGGEDSFRLHITMGPDL